MDNIKDIVKKVVGDLVLQKPKEQALIQDRWGRIVDKKALGHTRLAGFKDGVLSVYVDSPVWLYEMNLKKTKIKEQLKQDVPELKDVYFRVGKIK